MASSFSLQGLHVILEFGILFLLLLLQLSAEKLMFMVRLLNQLRISEGVKCCRKKIENETIFLLPLTYRDRRVLSGVLSEITSFRKGLTLD